MEIRTFLGMLILAGSLKQSLEGLFSQDGFGIEAFDCIMSLKKFDKANNRAKRRALDKFAPS